MMSPVQVDVAVIPHHVLVGVSDKDRKILWGRSGNRCALCRQVLVAERTSADGDAVVGDEAHIAARSPGGARYGECSPDKVDSYENLILLCRIDHKKVDDQPRHYTTARLKQAKVKHERWVEHALGDVPARPMVHNKISGTINGTVLQAGSVTLTNPLPAQTATANLPGQQGFVGREGQLEALREALDPERPRMPLAVCVSGLAGVGKTALVVKAGHKFHEWFPGGVLFIDLQGYDPRSRIGPEQALGFFLTALGIPEECVPPSQVEREALYRSMLADRAAEPVLIVADNASTAAQVSPLLPSVGAHRLLITSRDKLSDVQGVRLVTLDVLGQDESLAMLDHVLSQACPKDARLFEDRDRAVELTRLCGHLPLALRIAAGQLAVDQDQPVAELVEALSDTRQRLAYLTSDDTLAVRSAFDLSYARLTPVQRRTFRLISLHPGLQLSTTAIEALTELSAGEARRNITALVRTHVLVPSGTRNWWGMHDLIRLYAAERAAQEETPIAREAAIERLLAHYVAMVTAVNQQVGLGWSSDKGGLFASRQHALDWTDIEWSNLTAVIALAARTNRHMHVCGLFYGLCCYIDRRRFHEGWITVCEQTINAARHLGARDAEGTAVMALGMAYSESGRFTDAAQKHAESLEIFRKLGIIQREGMALGNLGSAYRDMGMKEAAVDHYRQAITAFRKAADPAGEGQVLLQWGVVEHNEGKIEQAISHFREAQRAFHQVGDPHGLATALHNLGSSLLGREGRWNESLQALVKAVDIYDEVGDSWGSAQALIALGIAYKRVGQPGQARTSWRDALRLTGQLDDSAARQIAEQTQLLLADLE